jgi:hypothetical protein
VPRSITTEHLVASFVSARSPFAIAFALAVAVVTTAAGTEELTFEGGVDLALMLAFNLVKPERVEAADAGRHSLHAIHCFLCLLR